MSERPEALHLVFEDDFDGPDLDTSVWLPHYLPAWSSREATAATYDLHDSCLHLTIPPAQGVWCAADHTRPCGYRASSPETSPDRWEVPSASSRTAMASSCARSRRPSGAGLPTVGTSSCGGRGVVTPRSMVAFWMVGLEDQPERSAEICVAEFHTYAVDWAADKADFLIDGELVCRCLRPRWYPMQMMLAVFDFPDQSTGEDAGAGPAFIVDRLRGCRR